MSEEEGEKLVAAVSLHYHQISIYVDEQGPEICSESLTYSISKQSSGTIILLHRSRELGSVLELVGCALHGCHRGSNFQTFRFFLHNSVERY